MATGRHGNSFGAFALAFVHTASAPVATGRHGNSFGAFALAFVHVASDPEDFVWLQVLAESDDVKNCCVECLQKCVMYHLKREVEGAKKAPAGVASCVATSLYSHACSLDS